MLLTALEQVAQRTPVFILVLFRIAGLMILEPVTGSMSIPARIKAFTALMISLAVFPIVQVELPVIATLPALSVAVGSELLIGLVIGFMITLLFTGLQVGAQLVGFQMGLGLADVVDPSMNANMNILSRLYALLVTMVYVLMNGHLILIRTVARTFDHWPLMSFHLDQLWLKQFADILAAAFSLAICIAAPALVAVFLATLALGFISRTMPQLNALAAGFPINIMLSVTLMVASMGIVFGLFQDHLIEMFRMIGWLFARGP